MSGILALINKDGARVDPEQLRSLAATMVDFAPDGSDLWCSGNVGLAHSLMRTGRPLESSEQPLTLDGEVCIVADARIDARAAGHACSALADSGLAGSMRTPCSLAQASDFSTASGVPTTSRMTQPRS